MGARTHGREEKLVKIDSQEFEDKIAEVDATLLPRKEEFTDWVETCITATQLDHLVDEPKKHKYTLAFLIRVELTHSLTDWVARWRRTMSELKRPSMERIAELQEKYAGIAKAEGWADEVEETCATPDLHDIIQRGFRAQNECVDEEIVLDELRAFINSGGDLEMRDNSHMTGLQRCKMLGWLAGRIVLEDTLGESEAA